MVLQGLMRICNAKVGESYLEEVVSVMAKGGKEGIAKMEAQINVCSEQGKTF